MARRTVGFEGGLDDGAAEKAVERLFSPEFCGRLDAVVRFNPVNNVMARQIAQSALARLGAKLSARGIILTPTEEAIDFIARQGQSEQYGARDMIRMVETDIKRLLTAQILFGSLANGGHARLEIKENKPAVTIS